MSDGKKLNWRKCREYADAEARWLETGDIGIAALAIGRWYRGFSWPEGQVPEWALEACAALFEDALVGIRPVLEKNKTQGSGPHPGDRELLDRVARIRNSEGSRTDMGPLPATKSIFRSILKDEQGLKGDQLDHSLRRLMRYWGPEQEDHDGVLCNEHMNRVAKIDALARGMGRELTDFREDETPSPKRRKPRRKPGS